MKYFILMGLLAAGRLSGQAILNFEQLEPRLHTESDTVWVVNFWATWCAPCVAELPYFEALHQQYKDKKVQVLLISLDHKSQVAARVVPFLEKHRLSPEVLVLSEKDPNLWVPRVSEDWTGSLPGTLIFSKAKRAFFERSFENLEAIEQVLHPFLETH